MRLFLVGTIWAGSFAFGGLLLQAQSTKAVHYRCPTGEEFSVDFKTGRNGRATIYMKDHPRLQLPQMVSASGARYSDGYTTFWEKGGIAMLEAGSVNVKNCGSKDADHPQPASSDAALPKGNWVLAELNGKSVDASRPPTLQFLPEDGRVAGFAGCNRYSSAFVREGKSFRFQGAIATKMACIGDAMAVEGAFLKAIESVRGINTTDSALTLSDDAGKTLLRFRPE